MEMNVAWMVGLVLTAYEYATAQVDRELSQLYHACRNPYGGYWHEDCFIMREVYGVECSHQQRSEDLFEEHYHTWHSGQPDHHVATFRFYESNRDSALPEPEPVAVIGADDDIPF
jgi:hypothetical protein